MIIGGLQKVSLIDYPGKISSIIFVQGCNFRCPYCHNPELVDPDCYGPCLSVQDIRRFLETRRGKLDAITVTGGEPALQDGLIPFIRNIREAGFAVKLDTNGSRPVIVERLIKEKLLDYIAMDVKAPMKKYPQIVQAPVDTDQIRQSIRLVLKSKISYEFRTTVVASQLASHDILQIGREIAGADRYVLQKFQPTKVLKKSFLMEKSLSDDELDKIGKQLEKDIRSIIIR